jgi:hypothetical protein
LSVMIRLRNVERVTIVNYTVDARTTFSLFRIALLEQQIVALDYHLLARA